MASVRYIVNDVDESVSFYRGRLGFAVEKLRLDDRSGGYGADDFALDETVSVFSLNRS